MRVRLLEVIRLSRARIVVVGSSNIDMVVKTDRIPGAGETLLGGDFVMVPGGKGANQAVCAAKLGADVKLVARVGEDVFGDTSLHNFESVGIDTRFVVRDAGYPSGVALITVDERGRNAIVVAPGANYALSPNDVENARDAIAEADAVVLQLEIPAETVEYTVELARSLGTPVVLNPAPIRPMSGDILSKVDVLTPNEYEAAGLLGRMGESVEDDPEGAAQKLISMGARCVVITLGEKGAYIAGENVSEYIEPKKVSAVDTTAAGDAFTGALACGLAEGMELPEAARFATRVAALSVTKMGAQPSMPSRIEVDSAEF